MVINISFNFVCIQNILGVWLFFCFTHMYIKAICKGQVTVGAWSKKWTRTPIIMSRKSNYFASSQHYYLTKNKHLYYNCYVTTEAIVHSKMPPAKSGCLLSFVKYIQNKTRTGDKLINCSEHVHSSRRYYKMTKTNS